MKAPMQAVQFGYWCFPTLIADTWVRSSASYISGRATFSANVLIIYRAASRAPWLEGVYSVNLELIKYLIFM